MVDFIFSIPLDFNNCSYSGQLIKKFSMPSLPRIGELIYFGKKISYQMDVIGVHNYLETGTIEVSGNTFGEEEDENFPKILDLLHEGWEYESDVDGEEDKRKFFKAVEKYKKT